MGTYDNFDYNVKDPHYFHDGRFYVPQGSTSATTSINTANQLGEVNNRLNAGVFGIDIAPINPEILEQIPQEHFKEMHRLAKLSGATVSMHGPILDLVGFEQNRFNELKREENERFAAFALERAHYLNPDGNTFMNIHINNQTPGVQWRAARQEEIDAAQKEPEKWKGVIEFNKFKTPAVKEGMGFVNRDTGEVGFFKLEQKEYPEGKKFWTPDARLDNINLTSWDQSQLQIFQLQKEKRDLIKAEIRNETELLDLEYRKQKGLQYDEDAYKHAVSERNLLQSHNNELDQLIGSGLRDVFHKLKFLPSDKEDAKRLQSFTNEVQTEFNKRYQEMEKLREKLFKERTEAAQQLEQQKPEWQKNYHRLIELHQENSQYLQNQLARVGDKKDPAKYVPVPELYAPTNVIAEKNTVDTISNSMFKTYEKFKDKSPIFTLENYQSYLTLGTSDEMVNVVKEARKEFANKLHKNMGLSEQEAKAAAEKHIAVTWDVGHINFMKRHGFKDSDVLEETKKIAPYVKQLHITDNFGFSDAHMPPGMGSAPIEGQFEILKDKGFKFDKGRLIVEAGPYVGTFKENPQLLTLEHFNSPFYADVTGMGTPNWNSFPGMSYGGFQTGFGNLLPDVHFRELYGSGFSSLPRELGGQTGGERDRFSGTPMQ